MRKERKIVTATEIDSALECQVIFQFNINKPKQESLLHYMAVYRPAFVRSFDDRHAKELLKILKYVQPLRLIYAHHALYIDLLGEPAAKHYF